MNKMACLIAVMALFAVASSQLIYGNGLLASPWASSGYVSSVAHQQPIITSAGLVGAAPISNAWTSHYAASPLLTTGYWKK